MFIDERQDILIDHEAGFAIFLLGIVSLFAGDVTLIFLIILQLQCSFPFFPINA